MKSGKKRIDTYKAKINPEIIGDKYSDTKKRAVDLETKYFKDHEKIQNQVKQMIGSESSIFHHYYMGFAMEIYKLKKKHTSETLENELEILDDKWGARGLNPIILNKIKSFYVQTYPHFCLFGEGKFGICTFG